MIDGELCQARIRELRADGTDRCRREARHDHLAYATGMRVALCTQHMKALRHRELLGSSEDMLRHWDGS
jgi:hypothetical protein